MFYSIKINWMYKYKEFSISRDFHFLIKKINYEIFFVNFINLNIIYLYF
jgi:hypothetical protein